MTIEQLQALPDKELNALAAKLRGWYDCEAGNRPCYHDSETLAEVCDNWTPATDRNQSGELLEWFIETQWKGLYLIRSGKLFRSVCLTAWTDGDDLNIEVNGTGAKAETIAFCAAMLAIQPN